MRRKLGVFALLAMLAALCLPVGTFAEEPEIEPFLARLDSARIRTEKDRILITEKALSKAGVDKVLFDDEELAIRVHYTVEQEGDSVIIRFRPRFLGRMAHGGHDVRIEFVEHSAETAFHVGEENSDVTAEPPRAAGWDRA